MQRDFREPQKRKPRLAKVCQLCRRGSAVVVHPVKWYRNAPIGRRHTREY